MDPKTSGSRVAKIRGQEFLLWSMSVNTQDIAIKRTMYELGFAKELFEANDEDYERFDIELRFALERNSEPSFGIDRTGFF